MKKNTLFFLLFCFSCFCLLSCSGSKESISADVAVPESMAFSAKGVNNTAVFQDSAVATEAFEKESAIEESNSSQNFERKLIYTADLSVKVENLTEAENDISNWVNEFSGYISYSMASNRNLNITARIPIGNFFAAMEKVNEFGNVDRRSIQTEDVTEQFYDVQSRLETRKILRDRLENYLTTAKNMEDLMTVERELNNVQSDIESMEGRLRRLSNKIDFATITINAYLPANSTDSGFIYPDLKQEFRYLWSDTVEFFVDLLFIIFYVIIFGIPILACVAFAYWLLFGRIGLLKKLFKFLKGKK